MKKHSATANFWDLTPVDNVLKARQFCVRHPKLPNSPVTFWAVFRGGVDLAIEVEPFVGKIVAEQGKYYVWEVFVKLMSPKFTNDDLAHLCNEIQRYNLRTY